MFEFGEITDIDAARGYVKVLIFETNNVTEWIPFVRRYYGESILIEQNEQVLVGQTGSGRWFVIGASPNDIEGPYSGASADKVGIRFKDGTLIEYDQAASKLTASTPGEVDVTASKVKIQAAIVEIVSPDITLSGAVSVLGELTLAAGMVLSGSAGVSSSGGGNFRIDGDIIAGTTSLTSHQHSGVQTGGGVTGPPLEI